ncbi:hypothetical protein [Streptomyces mirabilis]|uniref:hypothetical protein n=1 Tax=Streptomyces mirabilis TaxID=68239 RepID=UPI00332ECFEB
MRLRLVQGQLGCVEAEPARRLADRVGFEFGQSFLERGGRLPVEALQGERGQQGPGVQLDADLPARGCGRAAFGVGERGSEIAGAACNHAQRPVRPCGQGRVAAPVRVCGGCGQVGAGA